MTVDRDRQRRIFLLQAFLALVGVFLALIINIFYVKHLNTQNDRRWCDLMVSLDRRYQAIPPGSNPQAQEFAQQVHSLRQELHCPADPSPVPSQK